MGNSRPSRSALVAASADADPVTRLVLGWLAGQRSESTRTAYTRDIGTTPRRRPSHAPSWLAWCQEQGVHPVTGATGLHVARYARQLDLAELSPARKLAAVSSWYAWLARRGHITASPAVGIARPRADPDTAARPVLTREQVLALVHAADTARGPQRARTAALMAVLLFTGARVCEVIGADVEDLGTDRGHRVLWVTRKNGRRLGLTLPGLAAARIDAYLAERAEGPGDGCLPPTCGGSYAASPRRPGSRSTWRHTSGRARCAAPSRRCTWTAGERCTTSRAPWGTRTHVPPGGTREAGLPAAIRPARPQPQPAAGPAR